MVASLTDKRIQWNHIHHSGHQPKKEFRNIATGLPAKVKPELAKVKTGGSIYVLMANPMRVIPIWNDTKSNDEDEQEFQQQLMDKQPGVVIAEAEDDKDKDDKENDSADQEGNYMPHISQETIDGYIVGIFGHLEEYTRRVHRDTSYSEVAICMRCH